MVQRRRDSAGSHWRPRDLRQTAVPGCAM